jgi:hypothetical protein
MGIFRTKTGAITKFGSLFKGKGADIVKPLKNEVQGVANTIIGQGGSSEGGSGLFGSLFFGQKTKKQKIAYLEGQIEGQSMGKGSESDSNVMGIVKLIGGALGIYLLLKIFKVIK